MKIRAIFEAAALYEGNADNKEKKRDVEKAKPFNRHARDEKRAEAGPVDRKSPAAVRSKSFSKSLGTVKRTADATSTLSPRSKTADFDYSPKNKMAEIVVATFPFTVDGKRIMVDASASFKIAFDRDGVSGETLKSITAEDGSGKDLSGVAGIRDDIEKRAGKVLHNNIGKIEKLEGGHQETENKRDPND